jgi:DNA gyrase/topoisomerase IV, subunit A
MDGLKPSQRKVLFACFKRNLRQEIKVAQLAGNVRTYSEAELLLADPRTCPVSRVDVILCNSRNVFCGCGIATRDTITSNGALCVGIHRTGIFMNVIISTHYPYDVSSILPMQATYQNIPHIITEKRL